MAQISANCSIKEFSIRKNANVLQSYSTIIIVVFLKMEKKAHNKK